VLSELDAVLSVACQDWVLSVDGHKIVCMFEDLGVSLDSELDEVDIADMSTAQLADSVVVCHHAHQAAGCRMLILAAAWADTHPRRATQLNEAGKPFPGGDRGRIFGAQSNPEASEFCPVEFGALQATSTAAAALLIADALDLRHRLPLIWYRVTASEISPSKARRVAQATRELSDEAAGLVDRGIVEHLATLPWNRFLLVLSALIIEADPKAAEHRAQAAERDRFVRARQANPAGLKLLIAQANAGDVLTFMAMVNRIADILAFDGDSDPVDVRRSKAIGILAQPAYALHLLITHQNQADKPNATKETLLRTDRARTHDFQAEDVERIDRRFADAAVTEAAGNENDPPAGYASVAELPTPKPTSWRPVLPTPRPRPWQPAESPSQDLPEVATDSWPDALNGDEPPDESVLPEDPALADRHESVRLDNPLAVDYRKLRPKLKLYVHITDQALRTGTGVARYNDVGPITVDQVRRFLNGVPAIPRRSAAHFTHFAESGNRDGAGDATVSEGALGTAPTTGSSTGAASYDIRVQPVLDPAAVAPVDGYEIPLRLREAVQLRNPADVYPYGTCTSHRMDLDHTNPYQPLKSSTPAGQTSLGNLGPLDRTHHRDKTHGLGSLRQPAAGIYLYRSPEAWIYLTTNAGTLCLGNTDYAHQVWTGAQAWALTA
jgi:hypothetical protein